MTTPQKADDFITVETDVSSPIPPLADVRAEIDRIDRTIQELIAERARFARQVGKAKGKLAAAVEYYRPEREAQVLRMVVDRNEGPLSDEVLVHVFREIMSAILGQKVHLANKRYLNILAGRRWVCR